MQIVQTEMSVFGQNVTITSKFQEYKFFSSLRPIRLQRINVEQCLRFCYCKSQKLYNLCYSNSSGTVLEIYPV
jgi:hypothetical protein